MESLGLFMHDLNMYDCSRWMVMAGWQHASRIECSIEKVLLLPPVLHFLAASHRRKQLIVYFAGVLLLLLLGE